MSYQSSPLAPPRVSSDSALPDQPLGPVADALPEVAPDSGAVAVSAPVESVSASIDSHSEEPTAMDSNVASLPAPTVVSSMVDAKASMAKAPIVNAAIANAAIAIERRAGRVSAWQASVPAVLLFALGVAARQAPLSGPAPLAEVASVPTSVAAGTVAPGETMIVSAKNVSGSSILRGRLQYAGGVRGRAPLSGEISRVLVREGQFVQVNDRVLQISASTGSRRVRRVERNQSSAESAQVEAVDAQTALQNKLAEAQNRLEAARERVARAGVRVAQAQDIVQKLQRGETVHIPDAPVESAPATRSNSSRRARRRAARREAQARQADARKAAQRAASRRARRESGASRDALNRNALNRNALSEALRESQSARRASDAAEADVESARPTVEEADKAAAAKTQQAAEARAAVESAQKRLVDGTGKEADVEAAKTAAVAAETGAAAARSRLSEARKTVAAKESALASARAAADKAASEAARAERKLQLFDSSPASESTRNETSPKESAAGTKDSEANGDENERIAESDGGASVSPVARAARLVEAALQESSAAIREARQLKSEVDEYDRQVKSTRRRLDTTGRELEAAQQTVLDDTIQTRLSSVRAPSSGTVLSVASLASEVSEGETIITIGRSNVLRVRFADHSGVWKTLRPGALLTASVQPDLDEPMSTPVVRFRSGANPAVVNTVPAMKAPNAKRDVGGVAIVARLRSVEAPQRPGQPAIMEAVIFNPRRPVATPNGLRRRRLFRPGMAILCSIDKPGKRRVINVPSGAVLRANANSKQATIAVLMPAPAPSPAVASAPVPAASPEFEGAPKPDKTQDGSIGSQPEAPVETPLSEEFADEVQQSNDGSWHRIEMRRVALGLNDGVQQEILSGLREGERIALRPAALRALTAGLGSRAAVRVQQADERAPGL